MKKNEGIEAILQMRRIKKLNVQFEIINEKERPKGRVIQVLSKSQL